MYPPPAKGMGSTVGITAMHSSVGLMTKLIREKTAPLSTSKAIRSSAIEWMRNAEGGGVFCEKSKACVPLSDRFLKQASCVG